MKKHEIDRFFHLLSRRFNYSTVILLTGAGAATMFGRIRPTMDLDFAVRLKARTQSQREKIWRQFAQAAKDTTLRTGIAVQYAEDIDRWSSITYLDYARRTIPYKQFRKIKVRLLAPEYWAIGKLTRYLDSDLHDLVEVLHQTKTKWRVCARLWGKALRKSPKSTACELFRWQVENFLAVYGTKIWKKNFDSVSALREFRKAAKIR